MDLLDDFWEYCSEYEIHRNYALWSALSLIGATLHRKVYFLHGDIEIHGNIYVLMVGPQGNGKSTCCDFARKLFTIVCDDLAIGASTQSAEDIVLTMSAKEFTREYRDENDVLVSVRPYAFFINEFKNFIAYSPIRMINFLGDIYDRKQFDSGTIKRGVESILNPSMNILGCENPDQYAKMMKNDVVTGGISRRFIIVYETDYAPGKAFITANSNAWQNCIARLTAVRSVKGQFKWAESGKKFYQPWYEENHNSLPSINNVVIRGYKSTKHIQLFKIAMGLDSSSDKPMLLFTDELLQRSLALLDVLELNMPKLSQAAGRSETVLGQIRAIEILRASGGVMPEKKLKHEVEGDFRNPMELYSAFRHMEDTDQVAKAMVNLPNVEGVLVPRYVYYLPSMWCVREGKMQKKETNGKV